MKTCKGIESKWCEVLPLIFWAKQVTIQKSTGYSPYFMVHSTHSLLPFDILEATYLLPPQDFRLSTEELISLCASQLAKQPEDIEWMWNTVTKFQCMSLKQFKKCHSSQIINLTSSLEL